MLHLLVHTIMTPAGTPRTGGCVTSGVRITNPADTLQCSTDAAPYRISELSESPADTGAG